jgi:hypothetical protein
MKLKLALLFCFYASCLCAQTGSTNSLVKYEKGNYKIEYPSSWKLDTSKKMNTELYVYSPKENANDRFDENINLIIQDLKGQAMDLDKFAKASLDQMKSMSKDVTINSSGKVVSGKKEYFKIIFGTISGAYKLKIEQYYFVSNGKAYVLTYSAEFDKFEKFKHAGEGILNSFSLKTK